MASQLKILNTIAKARSYVKDLRERRCSIGLIPTMGALHNGHLSLVRASVESNDETIVSIFVNPTQFGEGEDYKEYPRPYETDIKAIERVGGTAVFVPKSGEMYNSAYATSVSVKRLAEGMCGASRPGHFDGVTTVVCKLFNILSPNRAYFGEKDAQQLRVIRQMVRDLNMPIEIIACPTIRENDGLAMSSRNQYLSSDERKQAISLYNALTAAKLLYESGETRSAKLEEVIYNELDKYTLATSEYVAIVDDTTLEPINTIENTTLIALAVRIGNTRLIDNITINK